MLSPSAIPSLAFCWLTFSMDRPRMLVSLTTSPSLFSQAQFLAPIKSAQYLFVNTRFPIMVMISSAFLVTLIARKDIVDGSKMLKLRTESFSNIAWNAVS